MKYDPKRKPPRLYNNDTLDQSWVRISRHQWRTKRRFGDPRMHRLVAARGRRMMAGYTAVLCDCDD